jgi:hypothetical protein
MHLLSFKFSFMMLTGAALVWSWYGRVEHGALWTMLAATEQVDNIFDDDDSSSSSSSHSNNNNTNTNINNNHHHHHNNNNITIRVGHHHHKRHL